MEIVVAEFLLRRVILLIITTTVINTVVGSVGSDLPHSNYRICLNMAGIYPSQDTYHLCDDDKKSIYYTE